MNIRFAVLALAFVAACDNAPVVEDTPKPAQPAAPAEPAPPPPPAAKPARRFMDVKGGVTIDGAPAKVDQEISTTAKIATAADGNAIITLGPGSLMEIRPNTKLELGKSARKESSVKLALGVIWSILPTGASYEAETLNAVAGVRGTTFFVEAQEKSTYVCACDGEVEMGSPKQKKFPPVVSKHEHKGFAFGPKAKKKAKLQNHSDEQAAKLFAMVPKAEAEAAPAPAPAPAPSPK